MLDKILNVEIDTSGYMRFLLTFWEDTDIIQVTCEDELEDSDIPLFRFLSSKPSWDILYIGGVGRCVWVEVDPYCREELERYICAFENDVWLSREKRSLLGRFREE